MSVADHGGWVSAGRARRLLVRVLLVLGGALVVTGVGWLIGTASASAAVLPTVPVPPSLSSVTDAIPAAPVTTPVAAPELPTVPATVPADLGQVTQQVHQAVSGFGDRVTPVTVPATALVPLPVTVNLPVNHTSTTGTPALGDQGTSPAWSSQAGFRPLVVVPHRHSVTMAARVQPRATGSGVPSPGVPQHRTPVLPPLQPAGSSDSNAHTTGGSAGGAGGTQVPFLAIVGAAPHAVGRPTTPRLPVAPGHQPGTSPD